MKQSVYKKMLQTITHWLLAACFLWLLPGGVQADSTDKWDGSTTETNWYDNNTSSTEFTISTTAELAGLAKLVNENTQNFENKNIKLNADIDLNNNKWTPIGTTANPFKGTFDGDHHTITLEIKADASQAQAGLFGTIDEGATVQKVAVNVVADGITSTASETESRAGAIAAINKGTIDQCYVSGNGFVLSSDGTTRHAGGIAGDNSGTISNCYNLIHVKVNKSSNAYFGGIAGYNTGTIEYCFASGEISIAYDAVISSLRDGVRDEIAGGIVGFNDHENAGVVKHCLAVNARIPENAPRVIGTGADADDVNNFSYYDMPRWGTKSASVYDPQEGTPLTSNNLNSEPGGCFNDWNTSIWDMSNLTILPQLQGFTAQSEKLIAPYLMYTINIETINNGTLSISGYKPLSGTNITVNNNDLVPYNTYLMINATPDADYELKSLTVNGTAINNEFGYTVNSEVTIKAVFSKKESKPDPEPEPEPEPTPVYYTVTLPIVEGIISGPVAGAYKVETGSNFQFYLTLDKEYDQSVPVVTTNRGETITPRSSDGAYIVKYVRTDVEIFIDGITKNPDPVANEKIEANGAKVWKTGNELHMQAATDEPGYVYTADGKLQSACHLIAGEVETVRLPDGIYFVRIGKERFKIVL